MSCLIAHPSAIILGADVYSDVIRAGVSATDGRIEGNSVYPMEWLDETLYPFLIG